MFCNVGVADSSWLKFPLDNNETMNFNIKDAIETGPNQYKIESVLTKDSKKQNIKRKLLKNLRSIAGKSLENMKFLKKCLQKAKQQCLEKFQL